MYSSLETAIKRAREQSVPLWKAFQLHDCREQGISEEESFERMKQMYMAMKQSNQQYNALQKSASGMVGGEAAKIAKLRQEDQLIVGDFIGRVMEKALRVAECNACMRRIVAAPTAGSCGVLPAVLLSYQEINDIDDDTMTQALYISAGVGGVIANRASLSGAAGGCQAEIGSASSMAASALVYLMGGNEKQMDDASALALKGLLGLVCDPVAGLVEVPCVKRNVIGAVNAVTSAQMVMAGIESFIPADQVFDAMGAVGRKLPEELRETSKAGLAVTPRALEITKKMSESN